MKLTVKQEALSRALASAGRIASSKAGLPILSNILLRTDGSRLLIASTNLELASTHYVSAKITTHGEVTVPARLVSEFVSNLPRKPIEIDVHNQKITFTCEGYTSTINGVSAADFPELPTIDEEKSVQYSVKVDDFKQVTAQTVFSCGNDVTRPVLTGVFWHSFEGWLYLVGTDGYRLAERRLLETQSELAAIIPTSALQEVLRVLTDGIETVDMLFDESQVRFRLGDSEITSRLIDGKYPDYRRLIPQSTETSLVLEKSELLRTTKIAALFSRSSGGSITLRADGEQNQFSVDSIASEVGENSSKIDTEVTGGGTITLNSRYILEVLGVMDSDKVEIGFSGKLAPCVLRPVAKDPQYLHIIMPLKS